VRSLACAIALLLSLALAACGGEDPKTPTTADPGPVRIGTKNFSESVTLGELYKQALEAKGMTVELQESVGSTEVTNAALRDGLLDMYPEYIGTLLAEVDRIVTRPAGSREAYLLAKRVEERRDFTLLEPARLSNEGALAVTRAYARRKGVRSIADLKGIKPTPRLGAAPEFKGRFEGVEGLKKRYGLTLKVKDVDTNKGLQYPELDSGKIDVASVYTTDRQLAGERYTLLSDPEGVFAKQHVAPLISKKALETHGPQLAATLNAVTALLTTPIMRELNAKAAKRSSRQVADEFLRLHNLK
jgi:osmoprotectant transport system substrate-binding protein